MTDLSRFEEFFAESLQTGVTAVNSVRFETSRLRENKDKARELAMKAAKEKLWPRLIRELGKVAFIEAASLFDRLRREKV